MKSRRDSVANSEKHNEMEASRSQMQAEHWSQLRLVTGLFSSRSYHTLTYFKGRMYVYGGYELHTGVKDDFIVFDYSSTHLGVPSKVKASNLSCSPGPIYRHSACEYEGNMIIFGGKKSSMSNSNRICRFNFETLVWDEVVPQFSSENAGQSGGILITEQRPGEMSIPSVESHSSVIEAKSGKMYVFGGFEKTNGFSNSVTVIDLNTNCYWGLSTLGIPPSARSSHTAAILNEHMYVFGGSNAHSKRLGDFWKLNLTSNCWTEILTSKTLSCIPQARSGHTMGVYENQVIIFGGILGVTREVNDLYSFDTLSSEWKVLENSVQSANTGGGLSSISASLGNVMNQSMSNFNARKKPSRQFSRFNTDNNNHSLAESQSQPNSCSTYRKQILHQQQTSVLLQEESIHRKKSVFQLMNSLNNNNSIVQNGNSSDDRSQEIGQKSNPKLSASSFHSSPKHSLYESQRPSMQLYKKQALRHAFNVQSNACFAQQQQLIIESPINSPNKWGYLSNGQWQKQQQTQSGFFLPLLDSVKPSEQNKSQHAQHHASSVQSSTHRQKPESGFQFEESVLSPSMSFVSFPKRVQKLEEIKPIQANPLKESLNILFDKIKCVGLNTLISKEEKYSQITELRKRILLREFVEPDATPNKAKGNQGESEDAWMNRQGGGERFPALKTPTTDSMMKAIKATHSRSIHDSSQRTMLSTLQDEINSQTIAQFKSVQVENCRIRKIRPQPRDGHAAVVVGNQLVILGGDRHRLSFNDMFECDLASMIAKTDATNHNHS